MVGTIATTWKIVSSVMMESVRH